MTTATDRVRAYLRAGPATREELSDALGLTSAQITHAVQGMLVRGEAHTVGRLPYVKGTTKGPTHAIYGLVGTSPIITPQSIVTAALANEPDLARVWR